MSCFNYCHFYCCYSYYYLFFVLFIAFYFILFYFIHIVICFYYHFTRSKPKSNVRPNFWSPIQVQHNPASSPIRAQSVGHETQPSCPIAPGQNWPSGQAQRTMAQSWPTFFLLQAPKPSVWFPPHLHGPIRHPHWPTQTTPTQRILLLAVHRAPVMRVECNN